MALTPADQFFAENGGAAMLSAYGIASEPTLAAFFGTNLPAKPKEGVDAARFTRPPATGIAAVAVWQGGMIVCSFAASPKEPIPGVEFRSGYGKKGIGSIAMLAADVMAKSRPILVHTCSTTYQDDLRNPRFTLDPSRVEINGATSLVLERARLDAIKNTIAATGVDAVNLRKALFEFERGFIADAPRTENGGWALLNAKANQRVAGLLGFKGKVLDKAQRENVRQFWQVLDVLPPSDDAAWRAFDQFDNEEDAE